MSENNKNDVVNETNNECSEICSICREVRDKTRTGKPNCCNHQFCFSCITQWSDSGQETCPLDREIFKYVEFYENGVLNASQNHYRRNNSHGTVVTLVDHINQNSGSSFERYPRNDESDWPNWIGIPIPIINANSGRGANAERNSAIFRYPRYIHEIYLRRGIISNRDGSDSELQNITNSRYQYQRSGLRNTGINSDPLPTSVNFEWPHNDREELSNREVRPTISTHQESSEADPCTCNSALDSLNTIDSPNENYCSMHSTEIGFLRDLAMLLNGHDRSVNNESQRSSHLPEGPSTTESDSACENSINSSTDDNGINIQDIKPTQDQRKI